MSDFGRIRANSEKSMKTAEREAAGATIGTPTGTLGWGKTGVPGLF
ncbi:hypothetical protein LCGC14_2652980 [marine sediment metagenome]|uniref:Uncharacterized protein n=1 Tax=marine sediment metagenome TaxID=412755 RepID=A0A0F9AGL9_9ZZZZ